MVEPTAQPFRKRVAAIALLTVVSAAPVWAQDAQEAMPPMDHDMMHDMDQEIDHSLDQGMDHDMMHMDHGTPSAQPNDAEPAEHSYEGAAMEEMDHNAEHGQPATPMHGMDHHMMHGMEHGHATPMSHDGMGHGAMQGGSAPPDARDPHAYSGGYTRDAGPYAQPGPRALRLADEHNFASLLVDRLEAVRGADNTFTAYDLQAWYGRDYDRAVLKAEGHYDNGEFEEASTELLWGHAVAAYWNSQLGLRHDRGEEPGRTWLAFGVQGLAPYWFEMDITAYLGEQGRTALNLEAEYELLFTQRLILQPRIEMGLYGKDDPDRGTGPGLSELKAGLRLRYEIRREFAPYVGIEWRGTFGGTADFARAAGQDTKETLAVAGVRFWF